MYYTGSDSRIGRCQGSALILGRAKPEPKELNLKGWAMQAHPKSRGCPTPSEPTFESRAVYYIDGYNLLFRLIESKQSLKKQRESVIRFLQKQFAHLKISGLLVFDGKHRRDEESGRSYPSPLEVVYTPKGQTADQYIIERLEFAKKSSFITVVTDDKHLASSARALGAKIQSNTDFVQWLDKKKVKKKEKKFIEAVDSQHQIDRLLKIFEEKLKDS